MESAKEFLRHLSTFIKDDNHTERGTNERKNVV